MLPHSCFLPQLIPYLICSHQHASKDSKATSLQLLLGVLKSKLELEGIYSSSVLKRHRFPFKRLGELHSPRGIKNTEQVKPGKKKQVRLLSFAVCNKIASISFNISKSSKFQPAGIWLCEIPAFANNCYPPKSRRKKKRENIL